MGDTEEMTVEDEGDEIIYEGEVVEGVQTSTADFLKEYWAQILIALVTVVFIYQRFIAPKVAKWLQDRSDREFEARLHKDPDLVRAREEAMQAARRRMQDQHDAEAAKKAEERKAREEKKRADMYAKKAKVLPHSGYTLSDNKSTDNKPSSGGRTDYNPLMGNGPSGNYRPARRSCPGGGCG